MVFQVVAALSLLLATCGDLIAKLPYVDFRAVLVSVCFLKVYVLEMALANLFGDIIQCNFY